MRIIKWQNPLSKWDEIHLQGELYMRRWHLYLPCGWRLQLNNIVSADTKRPIHTHPMEAWSAILNGGYTEEIWHRIYTNQQIHTSRRKFRAISLRRLLICTQATMWKRWHEFLGDRVSMGRTWGTMINHIKPDEAHAIREVLPNTWTLMLRAPSTKSWGYINQYGNEVLQ